MKKLILMAVVALCAFTTASAQERERWGVGPKLGVYTHAGGDGAIMGIGASARYEITNRWRLEPGITALLKDDCSIDINCDLQYLFDVARWWSVYPQIGSSGNDIYDWSFGLDLGAGTDFALSRRWDLSAGVKWRLQTAAHHDNPIIINVGATYKF